MDDIRREGVAIISLIMVLTRSAFGSKLLVVFVAEESVTMIFQLLRLLLHSRRPCICIGDEVVASEADPNWKYLSKVA